MLVLACDTSTPAVTVALVELSASPVAVLAESTVVDARRHGELLGVGIADVLSRAGVRPRDLGALAVGVGPGPFTGLRVGIVTAASMAHALGIPAYGACSLDALAASADIDGEVVAVTDARRREVYWARYDAAGVRRDGPHVTSPRQLAAELRDRTARHPGAVHLIGVGAQLYAEHFPSGAVRREPAYPSAAGLIGLVRAVALAGAQPAPLQPLYLRRPDAVEPPRQPAPTLV